VEDVSPPNPVLVEAIDGLCEGHDLDLNRSEAVLLEIMNGRVNQSQVAGFLIALRAKGETAAELAGLAKAMRSLATKVDCSRTDLVDTAGTGGGNGTFNVSTTAALIAAGAGCAVAKHGNRSATSLSGSADLLEALGVGLDSDPSLVARCIDEVGFGFMFAPAHHPATRFVVPVRKALGTRTAFNLLGPLTNPAGADRQIIGVSDPAVLKRMAEALVLLGTKRALVIWGTDGVDELSISAQSLVTEVRDGVINEFEVSPEELGLSRAPIETVAGGTPAENAAVTRSVLAGDTGPQRDLAVINAAAAILVSGDDSDLSEATRRAEEAIDTGAAGQVLDRLVALTGGAGS